MKKGLLIILVLSFVLPGMAQEQSQDDYIKVLTGRTDKIVSTLGISDSVKYKSVREILVNQYVSLGRIHDGADAKVKSIKESDAQKNVKDSLIKASENERNASLYQLHCAFTAFLDGNLSHEQVEKVKNGMTYNVLNVTYKAQLEMIPTLKEEEKQIIYIWLLEAREHAIDGASSDMKHAWFGKYKGKINNYLSSRGYNLTKERDGWNERIKAGKK